MPKINYCIQKPPHTVVHLLPVGLTLGHERVGVLDSIDFAVHRIQWANEC